MAPELFPDLDPTRDVRRELAPRLGTLLGSLGSRKAAWELLRASGIAMPGLATFYSRVRERGIDGFVDTLFDSPAQIAAIRYLVDHPPAPPLPRVAVSTLANQFYCEQQVHLDQLHDVRVVSAEMLAGTAGHARLEAEAEPITDAEIARRMAAGESMGLVELGLRADVHGIDLVGRLDRVQLDGRRARLVLEFKFSGRREVYPSHVSQVEAYGELLARSHFDITSLVHAVAILPRGRARDPGLADLLAARALELASREPWTTPRAFRADDPMHGLQTRRIETDDYALEVFPHDPEAAAAHLEWAASYWRGERAPVATTFAGKCRACALNAAGLCAVARAEPDGRYRASVTQGRGGRTLHLLAPSR